MENNASSVIIKVTDIDICRSFYRNIMNMGDPMINSNFRVEFVMGNNANLILLLEEGGIEFKESTPAPCIELNETTTEICARLDELECKYEFVSHADKDIYRMRDPENKLIMFTGHSTSSSHHRPKHRRTAIQHSTTVTKILRRKPSAKVTPEL
jgi:hypothetical protein